MKLINKAATHPFFRRALLALAVLASSGLAARAQFSEYFTNPVAADGIYSWDATNNWSGAAAGPFVGSWTNGDFARFPGGASISYTVTVNNVESMAGMFNSVASTLVLVDAGNGTGFISIPTNTIQAGFGPTQGFLTAGGVTTILVPMIGPGGVEEEAGGGHLQLFGTNSYSGGTLFTSSSTFVDFNNPASFGIGPIGFDNTTFSLFEAEGGAPINIANSVQILGGTTGVDFLPLAGSSITMSGPWNMSTFNVNIRLASANAATTLTLSGPISGTGGTLNFSANSPAAPITVSGANTYTGPTTIGGAGSATPTVSVTSINSVTTPAQQASSSLGKPSSAANGTIGIGTTTVSGILVYTGAGETSDRVINLSGTTGKSTIEMDGTGPLNLTSAFTATGAGSKTLFLQGSSTAANSIGGPIVDNSSVNKTTLVKAQAGKWVLGGASAYSGGTTVSNGTLEVSGSIAGNVVVAGGTLQLDSATALSSPSTATFTVSGTGSAFLNFAGAQTVNSLVIGGVTEAAGTWGSSTSGAQHTSAVFTGNGLLNVGGAPVVTTAPVSQSVWQGSPVTFTVAALGSPTFQWKYDGASIPGANSSSYTIPSTTTANSGLYACALTNGFGGIISPSASLTVRTTNAYTSIVLSDSPMAYWRLDETNGSTAFDAVSTNNGTYHNTVLGITPGYSTIDSDPAVYLPAIGSLVATPAVFDFFTNSSPQFTLEGWVYFTNVTSGVQRLFSCFQVEFFPTNAGFAFGIKDQNTLEFSTLGFSDFTNVLSAPLQNDVWYQLAVGCDGSALHFYINGQPVGVQFFASYPSGVGGTASLPITLGADNDPGLPNLHEQVLGFMDECSVYGTFLGDSEIMAHYDATLPNAPVAQPPVADFPTNYVSLTTTFIENAVGQNLNYQWFSIIGGVTNPVGVNSSTLVLSDLTTSEAGSYYCNVSNGGGSTNTPAASLTVLLIPTNAAQLNITNELVLHLPFDGNYSDISGHNNNATAVGSPTLGNSGAAVGSGYFTFESDSNTPSFNYATLGKPHDLLFSNSVDFSVAFWIRQAYANIGTNLPFFDNTVGSFGAPDGYCFSPGEAIGGSFNGAWAWSGGDGTHFIADQGGAGSISDGNWHHLTFVFSRTGNETTYLDGKYNSTQPIAAITNFDTANVLNIGQDASGVYASTTPTTGDMDDMGVWRRTLSAFEISGIYLAGISNSVSFAPVVVLTPTPTPVTISNIIGSTLAYGGGSGSQFILMATNALPGSLAGWTPLATNNATPGVFTIPLTNNAEFFYIQSK